MSAEAKIIITADATQAQSAVAAVGKDLPAAFAKSAAAAEAAAGSFRKAGAAVGTIPDAAGKAAGATRGLSESIEGFGKGVGAHERTANRMTRVFGELGAAASGGGEGVGKLVGVLGVMAGPIGLAATAGTVLIGILKSYQEEATKALAKTTNLSEGIGTSFQAANADIRRITAEISGDQGAAAQAAFDKVRILAEAEKDAKINNAIIAGEKGQELILTRLEAEQKARDAIRVGEAQLKAERVKLIDQQIVLMKSIVFAAVDAEAGRVAAQQKASGQILASLDTEATQAVEVLKREREQKLESLKLFAGDAAAQAEGRQLIEQTYLDKIVAGEVAAAEKRRQAVEGFVNGALALVAKLGPQFDDLATKLQLQQAIGEARKGLADFYGLVTSGDRTMAEFKDVAAAVTDNLTKMGASAAEAFDAIPPAARRATDDVGKWVTVTDAATGATAHLADELNGHSLDSSLADVSQELQRTTDNATKYKNAINLDVAVTREATAANQSFKSSFVQADLDKGTAALGRYNGAVKQTKAAVTETTDQVQKYSEATFKSSETIGQAQAATGEFAQGLRSLDAYFADVAASASKCATDVEHVTTALLAGTQAAQSAANTALFGQGTVSGPGGTFTGAGAGALAGGGSISTSISAVDLAVIAAGGTPGPFSKGATGQERGAAIDALNRIKAQAAEQARAQKLLDDFMNGPTTTPDTLGGGGFTSPGGGSLSGPAASGGSAGFFGTGVPSFAGGGVMPGAPGKHYPAWVEGGEVVFKPDQLRMLKGGGGDTFNITATGSNAQEITRLVMQEIQRLKRTRSNPVGT